MITDTMVYQNTPSGGVVDQENKLDKPRKPHVVFMLGACLIIAALFVAFSFRSTYLPNSQTNTDVIPLPDSSQQIDAPLADFSTNISGSDKKIVYIKDGDAFIYDLENSHVVKLTESGYVSDVRLSPDSSKVAYLEIPTSVVSTGNVQKMPGSGIFHTPLSYGDYENIRDLFVVSSTGSNQVKINIGEMARRTVAWSPISNKIVYEEEGRIVF